MTDVPPRPDGIAPLREQMLRANDRAQFIELSKELYSSEVDDIRERRGEFGVEEEQSYANAAARACAQAAWFLLIRADFMDEKFSPVRRVRRRGKTPKRRRR